MDSIKLLIKHLNKKQKIIYPTTNSGYGVGEKNKFCDENSPLRPVSLYGVTKLQAEKIILSHKNSICFRLATVFGYSYRMRTDLIVNNFTQKAAESLKLTAQDCLKHKIIDSIVEEVDGGAHRFPEDQAIILKNYIINSINDLKTLSTETRRKTRNEKFLNMTSESYAP